MTYANLEGYRISVPLHWWSVLLFAAAQMLVADIEYATLPILMYVLLKRTYARFSWSCARAEIPRVRGTGQHR